MTCAGSWDAPQVTGEDVDPTGLTFTVTYTGGATKDVTSDVTVSPAKWGDTPGSQTTTFKAIAVKDGMADSAVVTEECEYVAPAAPSDDPSDNPE